MNLLIINDSSVRQPRAFLQKWIAALSVHLLRQKIISAQIQKKELTLVFLNPTAARKLNFEFRNRRYATDVLSFSSEDPDSLGELVLCPQVLQRQAKEHDLSYQKELGYMVLHGVLHLLGYDHEVSEKEAQKMFRLQDELFEKMLARLRSVD